MMGELREVQAAIQPSDTLLVVDAMTGQEAAGLVKSFNEAAEITGAACLLGGKRLVPAAMSPSLPAPLGQAELPAVVCPSP